MSFANPNVSSLDTINAGLAKFQFRTQPMQRAAFYEMMASLISDGTALDSALRQLHHRYAEKKRPLAPILRRWVAAMDEGRTFADASRSFISDTESVIIAAGEKSGDLPVAFAQAGLVARAGAAINKTIRTEMATPCVQVVLLVGMLVGFSTQVAPGLLRSIPMTAMDGSQQALFRLAETVASTWFVAVPAMAVAMALAIWSMPRYNGALRPYLNRLPPWSVYQIYSGSTFMIALSALIRAGVPIEAAIRFIRNHSAPVMRQYLGEMIARLRSGMDQGVAMDVGLLSDDLSDAVAVYSKTTTFDAAMSKIGNEAIESGINGIKLKASVARIAATLLIGVLVGWMFDAMMGLSDAATRAQQQQMQQAASRR